MAETGPVVNNPTAPEKVADTWEELNDLKRKADLNQDGKLSAYELMNAFITMPKFFALLVSFIMSVYAAVVGVMGFITRELNVVAFVIALCIVISLIILYLILSRFGKAQVKTIENLNGNWNEREDKKVRYIERLEMDARQSYEKELAWKTKASFYKYASDVNHAKHPEDPMPDITTLEEL